MKDTCNRIIEYLNERKGEKITLEMEQHIKECKDCAVHWKNYKRMIQVCNSFPKIAMSLELQEKICNIANLTYKDANLGKANKNKNLLEHIAAVASVLIVFTIFMYLYAASAPGLTAELPAKGDIWIHKIYSKAVKIFYKKDVVLGDIQYMSLPASKKLEELYSSFVKDEVKTKEETKGMEKEKKK